MSRLIKETEGLSTTNAIPLSEDRADINIKQIRKDFKNSENLVMVFTQILY